MYGRDMKDHNWRRGGYGTMRLPKSLEVSSNIGVSRIIDNFYHNNPEKYVQGLYDLGLADDLEVAKGSCGYDDMSVIVANCCVSFCFFPRYVIGVLFNFHFSDFADFLYVFK